MCNEWQQDHAFQAKHSVGDLKLSVTLSVTLSTTAQGVSGIHQYPQASVVQGSRSVLIMPRLVPTQPPARPGAPLLLAQVLGPGLRSQRKRNVSFYMDRQQRWHCRGPNGLMTAACRGSHSGCASTGEHPFGEYESGRGGAQRRAVAGGKLATMPPTASGGELPRMQMRVCPVLLQAVSLVRPRC